MNQSNNNELIIYPNRISKFFLLLVAMITVISGFSMIAEENPTGIVCVPLGFWLIWLAIQQLNPKLAWLKINPTGFSYLHQSKIYHLRWNEITEMKMVYMYRAQLISFTSYGKTHILPGSYGGMPIKSFLRFLQFMQARALGQDNQP